MASFWRTRNGFWHVRLGLKHWRRLLSQEQWRENVVALGRSVARNPRFFGPLKRLGQRLGLVRQQSWDGSPHQASPARRQMTFQFLKPPGVAPEAGPSPVIFASCCVNAEFAGGWKFSGGVKELNALVKLVRRHGYEAYMVTWDGSCEPWLEDHQPHLSIAEYRDRLARGGPVRCVTSYAIAQAFTRPAPALYFWDMELALTENEQFATLCALADKITRTAGISRTIQAWHMARFGREALTLPALQDEVIYRPAPERRQRGRVGYMNEGDHSEEYVAFLRETCAKRGSELTFMRIAGVESEYASALQSCDFYISLNLGKDLFWGEGCPLTVSESMACGCVLLAFDVIGNREMIVDGFNAVLLPRYRVDLMAEALIRLSNDANERERLRGNALNLTQSCHKLEDRWPIVREFLQLA
jgi:glycosyltransferase involved in cell wall biosynthesis